MAFTYFLILWSMAWSPSRLCESKERKQTELVSPAKHGRRSPQPSWPLEGRLLCHADVRGSGQAPRAGRGAGGIPGTPEPQRPVGPLPGLSSPRLWLPGRALAAPREAGFEQDGSRRWEAQPACPASLWIPAASSNHRKCLSGSRRGCFNQGGDEASCSTNTPTHPHTTPARVPTAWGQAQWERPSRAPSSLKGSMAEPKPGPTSLQCPTGT